MKPYDGFEENKDKISVIISQRKKEQTVYEQPRIWDRVYEYPEPAKEKKKNPERGICIIQF